MAVTSTILAVDSFQKAELIDEVEQANFDQINEPITLEEAKKHLRVVYSDEDSYISALITAAREMAEGRINRAIAQRQFVSTFASWHDRMTLRKPPLLSVDSVEYLDTDGALQTFFDFDLIGQEVFLAHGIAAPALRYRRDAVRITYTAGYLPGQVPRSIIQWMLLAIGAMYEHRESVVAGVTVEPLPADFMSLLIQPYMVYE